MEIHIKPGCFRQILFAENVIYAFTYILSCDDILFSGKTIKSFVGYVGCSCPGDLLFIGIAVCLQNTVDDLFRIIQYDYAVFLRNIHESSSCLALCCPLYMFLL